MPDNEGVRRADEPYVVNMFPDVCLTPLGSLMVPVPYQIYGSFTAVERAELTVRMDKRETVTAQSYIPHVVGNELGTGGGILSGVNRGTCNAITYSSTVFASGQQIVRHTSLYWMNCQGPDGAWNTVGITMYFPAGTKPAAGVDWGSLAAAYKPPAEKKGALHHVGGFFKGLGNAAWGTVKSLGEMAIRTNPIVSTYELTTTGSNYSTEMAQGIWSAVKDPGAAWDAITAPLADAWNRGDYGEFAGMITFEVVAMVVGTKGVDKLAKGAKIADKVSDAAKVGDKLSDVSKIGKTGEGIEDLAKVESKLDDVARAEDKLSKAEKGLEAADDGIRVSKNATAATDKFESYIFKDGATHGKDAPFRSLGYGKEHSEQLAKLWEKQGAEKFATGDYTLGKLDQYGQRINIQIDVPGIGNAAGKTSHMNSGWMIQPNGSITLNTPFAGFTK